MTSCRYRDSPHAKPGNTNVVLIDPVWWMLVLLLLVAIFLSSANPKKSTSKQFSDRPTSMESGYGGNQSIFWLIPTLSGNPGASTALGGTPSLGGGSR
ncbi:hypothetical protein KF728_15110 [Candidatus Obscuribacterales bacterium]|nr:hypothetical protein [Candidatus Obscuribacterales bacterium]